MHLITLREILRDADIAHAISSVVREHSLSEEQTEQALIALHVPPPSERGPNQSLVRPLGPYRRASSEIASCSAAFINWKCEGSGYPTDWQCYGDGGIV